MGFEIPVWVSDRFLGFEVFGGFLIFKSDVREREGIRMGHPVGFEVRVSRSLRIAFTRKFCWLPYVPGGSFEKKIVI